MTIIVLTVTGIDSLNNEPAVFVNIESFSDNCWWSIHHSIAPLSCMNETITNLYTLCTSYIFCAETSMAINVRSNCISYLSILWSKLYYFVALLECWRDKKMTFLSTGFLLFGDHCGMVHCGCDECVADNTPLWRHRGIYDITHASMTSLSKWLYSNSWYCLINRQGELKCLELTDKVNKCHILLQISLGDDLVFYFITIRRPRLVVWV